MNIYHLNTDDEEFSPFYMPMESEYNWLKDFASERLDEDELVVEDWQPIIVLKKEVRRHPDFAFLDDEHIMISQKAVDALKDILDERVELLPLINDETNYYLLKVLSADVLDHERAIVERLPIGNQILRIKHYSFIPEKAEPLGIFRIPGLPYEVFVTERFRARCEAHNLQGLSVFENEIIWSYEPELRI